MSTHLPGFQSFFRFLHHVMFAKLVSSSMRYSCVISKSIIVPDNTYQKDILTWIGQNMVLCFISHIAILHNEIKISLQMKSLFCITMVIAVMWSCLSSWVGCHDFRDPIDVPAYSYKHAGFKGFWAPLWSIADGTRQDPAPVCTKAGQRASTIPLKIQKFHKCGTYMYNKHFFKP